MKKRLLFFTVSLLSLWQLRSQTTNGLSFDGANDYIACGNILTTSYTKEAWVMTNGGGLQNNFVSGGSAGQHALWAPNSYGYKLSGGHNGAWNQVQDAVALTLGTWYHIALTYDAATTTMKLYKNGVLTSSNTSVPAYGGGTMLQLGSYDPGGNLMNGSMDEVRIWNYARTATDIFNNMNCELNIPQSGLIAYYRFNQGIAAANNTGINTLTDLSGNNNTGTLNSFALNGATSNWILGSPVNPLPNVTASATNPVVCLGNQTTLNGGGASTYLWTGSVTDAVAFAPTVSGTYTVTGTDANGCINTAFTSITVNNLPTVTINVTNASVCLGNSTTLSGSGASTYVWTGSVTDAVAFAPSISDTYTVTGTDANGCSNTAVQSIVVNGLPNVTASVSNSVICSGNTVVFNGGGASTYIWTGGVTNNAAFSPTITDTYTVTGTDANGCINTAVTSITVNNLPTVTINVTNASVCLGNSTTLSGSGASTYTWTGSVTDAVAFAPAVTDTYTVTGTDANGCINTAVQTVVVNNLPNVTASVSNSVICSGNTVIFNGGGASTYIWSGGVTNNAAFSPTITDTYTVTGTDANGCINTAVTSITVNNLPTVTINVTNASVCLGNSTTLSGSGASTYTWTGSVTDAVAFAPAVTDTYTVTGTDANGCINTAVQTVVVNNLPNVTASVSNSVICSGNTVIFNGGGASTYTWTGGVTNNAAFSPTTTDTYTVTGTDANGCINTAIESVTVNTTPSVFATSNGSVICVGQTATLTAGGANTYSWSTTATSSVITITPGTTTSYTVTGTSNGCSDFVVVTQSVSVCTGITSNVNNSIFNVYPNPTNGLLNIKSTTDINLIEVVDFTGRVVVSEETQNVNSFILDIASLQNAIYLVRITNVEGSINQSRIVLQK